MFIEQHDGFALRGEFDENRVMWIPGEDVARIRGVPPLRTRDLRRAGLREEIDFRVIHTHHDELGRKLRLYSEGRGNPRRVLLSEPGMYMLMMSGRGKQDRKLQYWLADEVIPSIRRYGEYNLPVDHPIYAVLQEVSGELKMYRELTAELAGDRPVRDLIDLGREQFIADKFMEVVEGEEPGWISAHEWKRGRNPYDEEEF